MPSVSHSEVENFLTCRRKHYYGYGLSLKRKSMGTGAGYGTVGHDVLAAFYHHILDAGDTRAKQKKAFDSALSVADAKLTEWEQGDEWDDDDPKRMSLRTVLFDYYFPNEPIVKGGYLIQGVELDFLLEYDSEQELRLPFVIDLIAVAQSGRTVVIDHKFLKQFYSLADTEVLTQLPKYIGGLRALGHRVDEGLYNLIKTYPYKNPPKPEQMLDQLPVKPNNARVQQVFIDQILTAEEIQGLKELDPETRDQRAYRVADIRVCRGCDFRSLCVTEQEGGSTKLLLATEYEVRERRVFADVSAEVDDEDVDPA